MNPNLQKQILIGLIAGLLVSGIAYLLMGGKRDELTALTAKVAQLDLDVQKGRQLKANYEKLKEEVEKSQARIDKLVALMPTDTDTGQIPYKIKKLADNSGIDQSSFAVKGERKDKYYTERMIDFDFRAGYNNFGLFASQVSGYERIISLSNLTFTRIDSKASPYPMTVHATVSAYVYNPEPAAPPPAPAAAPRPAAGTAD
ncbi:MAG TPA: type 4a pilus biogenesis protein PilO [Holophagaceae bacterium]|jgi:Tfp pilus assembly protein PilO|nr:type 4a pilus biogenesis protein PilO [Holophagaceae bacterium]